MQKIISLFCRNYDGDRLVRDEIVPGAEWVVAGEGVATRKWDGTCCLVRDGKLFKRYDAKKGKKPPENFEPAQPEPDPETGHWPGWVPVSYEPSGGGYFQADRWHREAFDAGYPDGTYELCGPRINGNPEKFSTHVLVPHGAALMEDCPRDFEGLKQAFQSHDIEGVVWHHPDGRMVKIKARDFGIKRKVL